MLEHAGCLLSQVAVTLFSLINLTRFTTKLQESAAQGNKHSLQENTSGSLIWSCPPKFQAFLATYWSDWPCSCAMQVFTTFSNGRRFQLFYINISDAKLLTMPARAVPVKLHQPSRSNTFSSPRLPQAEEATASSNTYSTAHCHSDADGLGKQRNVGSSFWLEVWSTNLLCPSHILEYLYQLRRMMGLSAGSLLCWQHNSITSSKRLGDYFEIKDYGVSVITPQSRLKFAFHHRPSSNASLRAEMDETT